METKHIAVVGAGAWGTALAATVLRAGRPATVYTRRDPESPGKEAFRVTNRQEDIRDAPAYLLAVPAQQLRGVLTEFAANGVPRQDAFLVLCCKGIENGTALLMHQIAEEYFPDNPVAVLSGPNFAAEVRQGLPAACVVASRRREDADACAAFVGHSRFRAYVSTDVVGVGIGGALKNVVAVACGMAAGKGLGENAVAALVTRGLAETARLAVAAGGEAATLYGLSGVGDMLLTCTSPASRNYSFGKALAQGARLDALRAQGGTVEGAATCLGARTLAERLGIDMPICLAVCRILFEDSPIDAEIEALPARPRGTE
jgi:glycerol-3-phosphate dehydrogenase (NAD(P)+)